MKLRVLLRFAAAFLAPCLVVLHAHQIAASTSSGNTLDLDGYVAELEKWSAAAERLKRHPEEAVALEPTLPKNWAVTVNGQHFLVATDWLRGELADFESDSSHSADHSGRMLVRLRAMRNAAEGMVTAPSSADGDARLKLGEILQRRQFRNVRGAGAVGTWWDRLWGWIANKIDQLLGSANSHPKTGRTLLWVVTAGFGLLLLGWMARSVLAARRQRPRVPPSAASSTAGSTEWAARALACAAQGDYREAIRWAYWAGVYRLQETGVWKADRSRTPREYLRLLPGNNDRRPRLEALTQCFERVWYAGGAASVDDFRSAAGALEELGCPLAWNPTIAGS